MPIRFAICLALFVAVNVGLAAQQHLVGRAVEDLQRGRAVVRLAGGALDMRPALMWVAILVGVATARGVLQYAAGVLSLTIGQELLSRLRDGILVQVQRLDLAYHLRHGVGEMVTRTTRDADKVRDALISVWRNVIETTLVIAGAIGLIAWYAPSLALGPALATVAGLAWLVRQVDKLVVLDRTVGAAFDAVNQDVSEGVHGVRVIKAFGLEPSRIARFEGAVGTFVGAAREALRFASTHIPVPQVIVAFSQVWVLVLGAWLVAHARLDVGSLVASLLMMNTVVFRVEAIGRVMQTFADARSSAARMMELLDAEPSIVDGTTGQGTVPAGPLGVRLSAVRVRSPGGDTDILTDCSLSVAPGEIVALVGATGSGKSTLSALLPRLVDADAGSVLVGSDARGWRDVRDIGLADLRRHVHVVPQEVFLFSDSVAANLRVGAPGAGEADLWSALRLAAADDVVQQLPQGLETRVGDRGVTLSGGQRQRLALARALVARPPVLVLDDATSALDALTERRILDGLRTLSAPGGRPVTVLVVASKLSTVLLADRAALLVGGRIVATGTHAHLARTQSGYRELLGIDEHGQPT
ncbi:MAG TPA: ABC transporter ATP-binding protein [Polyangia bacterium]|nr:ABC transporter ATP-binding protein [Polyangia bacterium]